MKVKGVRRIATAVTLGASVFTGGIMAATTMQTTQVEAAEPLPDGKYYTTPEKEAEKNGTCNILIKMHIVNTDKTMSVPLQVNTPPYYFINPVFLTEPEEGEDWDAGDSTFKGWFGDVYFEDGIGEFNLKDGEQILLKNLPIFISGYSLNYGVGLTEEGEKYWKISSGQLSLLSNLKKDQTHTVDVFAYPKDTSFIAPKGVTFDKNKLEITKGKTSVISASVFPENATAKHITWSSSDPSVATVDENGKVTAKKSGTTTIKAYATAFIPYSTGERGTYGDIATCTVTVTEPATTVKATGVNLNKSSMSLTKGATQTLTATVSPANATNKNVTWSSSNTAVATVDKSGKVTAVKAGTATITAKTSDGGKTVTCKVTVSEPATTVKVTGVSLNKSSMSLTKGATQTLTATVSPSNATNKAVTWSSSNTVVATVDTNGNVKAVNPGTATITVKTKDGNKTATCKVTVPNVWSRLWGQDKYDTMKEIVNAGFTGTGGTVIVATGENFKDALAASGLAGVENAPVVLTNGETLSTQAKDVLNRIKPQKVYIAGGPFAISDKVAYSIKNITGGTIQRLYGQGSADTSAALALKGNGSWKDSTAIIATNKSFKDALSVAPIAYVKKYPVLLADNGTTLNSSVLNALNSLGIKNVIIVGGKEAVTENVEKQLRSAGITIKTRLWGQMAVDTSKAIAEWGIANGMNANKMGVATSQNFPDALAGAAFCGKNKSVLVLADDKASLNATFPKAYKNNITRGYVFGGELAVGKQTMTTLENSVRQ